MAISEKNEIPLKIWQLWRHSFHNKILTQSTTVVLVIPLFMIACLFVGLAYYQGQEYCV
jgi:hypothetical protein